MARPPLRATKYPCIKKDDKGRYYVDIYLSGRRKRFCCGSLVDARAYLANLQEKDRRAKLFPDEAAASETRQVFSLPDLAERYEEQIKESVAEKTWLSYTNSDKHLREFFGEMPLGVIDAELVREFRRRRAAQGAKPNSINRDLERLRALLNLAERDSLIGRSPMRGHRLMTTAQGRVRWLTQDERQALKAACLAHDPELWPLVVFSFLTGLRAREQWYLTWQKVILPEDPEQPGFLIVPRPKTSTKDHLPIKPTVRAILAGQRGKSNYWVFPNQSGSNAIDHDNLTDRRFRPMLEIAGIRDFSWHDLRHDFCSQLAMGGEDIQVIRALAGHSSISTTMKYSHLNPGYLSRGLDTIEQPGLLH